MEDRSKKNAPDEMQGADSESGEEVVEDFAVVPAPANGEAVKEALDIAQSFGGTRGNKPLGTAFHVNNFDDSVSLSEYIDEAEKKALSLFEPAESKKGQLEDLDVLSIAAEFGRPEDSSESGEDSSQFRDRESNFEIFAEEEQGEDTRDITAKSKMPYAGEEDSKRITSGENPGLDTHSKSGRVDQIGETEPLGPVHIASGVSLLGIEGDFGELSSDKIVDIFLTIYLEKTTGMLILKDGQTTCRVFVQEGDVITAETSNNTLGLVTWLRNEGYLNNKTYGELVREVSSLNTLQRGAALVSRGIIGPREMNRLLRKYYEVVVMALFAWTRGTWRLERSGNISPGDTSVSIDSPTPGLILQGIVAHAPIDIVERIAPRNCVMRRTREGICKIAELGLDDAARSILDECDGSSRVWKRVAQNPYEADRYHRLIAGFVKFQFLEVEALLGSDSDITTSLSSRRPGRRMHSEDEPKSDVGSNVSVDEPNGDFVSQGDDSAFGTPSDVQEERPKKEESVKSDFVLETFEQSVINKMKAVKNGSYYDVLGVDMSASKKEVTKRRMHLLAHFDTARLSTQVPASLEKDAYLIRSIVDEAYEVLVHPKISQKYRKAQSARFDGGIR